MSFEKVDCLIIGAGPTGLTLGLHLLKHGKSVLIVDKHQHQLAYSRANLINPDALAALNIFGVSARLRNVAMRVDGLSIYQNGNLISCAQFDTNTEDELHPVYLPQRTTENCMIAAFLKNGGRLMRNVMFDKSDSDLKGCENGTPIRVSLKTSRDWPDQSTAHSELAVECDWLFGCDGVHSMVRESLHIGFRGVSPTERMYQIEAVIHSWSMPTQISMRFGENSIQFVLLISASPLTVQVFGSTRAVCHSVLRRFAVKHIVWDGSFTNAFRVAESFGRGHVWLAGDAAHVHSPIGGRGMNYGILDAVELANAVASDSLHTYERSRRPVALVWVWCNYFISQVVMGDGWFYRLLRSFLTPLVFGLAYALGPVLPRVLFETITTAPVSLLRT